jgi:hypothetical protein
MSKAEGLSARALAADSILDLWGLFVTDEILDKIVQYTNEKIREDLERNQYSWEYIVKNPYMKPIDKVIPHLLPPNLECSGFAELLTFILIITMQALEMLL